MVLGFAFEASCSSIQYGGGGAGDQGGGFVTVSDHTPRMCFVLHLFQSFLSQVTFVVILV